MVACTSDVMVASVCLLLSVTCAVVAADRRGAAEVRKQVSSAYLGEGNKNTASSVVSFSSRQNV